MSINFFLFNDLLYGAILAHNIHILHSAMMIPWHTDVLQWVMGVYNNKLFTLVYVQIGCSMPLSGSFHVPHSKYQNPPLHWYTKLIVILLLEAHPGFLQFTEKKLQLTIPTKKNCGFHLCQRWHYPFQQKPGHSGVPQISTAQFWSVFSEVLSNTQDLDVIDGDITLCSTEAWVR